MTNLYNVDVVCYLGSKVRHFKRLHKQPLCNVLKDTAVLYFIGFVCVKCISLSITEDPCLRFV
jgi:hypothetical protein